MPEQFQILVINQISEKGLAMLPPELYSWSRSVEMPDAILVRSSDIHSLEISPTVKAIARAGAGTNNIPVKAMSARGVPVFNAPGANANAVKELTLTAMLMASRNLARALDFVRALDPAEPDMHTAIEDGKKAFAGTELAGQSLGVVGLGKIGCLIADAAIKLGMEVRGFDPGITVEAAWSLSSQVKKAQSLDEILRSSTYITLHVPLLDATRGLINARNLELVQPGSVLVNFAREKVIDEPAVRAALDSGRLRAYVSDFPTPGLHRHPKVIAFPHLGASTAEAEENCSLMVVAQIRDFLENGNVENAVNFPNVSMPRESAYRIALANSNVPNIVSQVSSAVAKAGLNIHNMMNKSQGDVAYTLLDVDSPVAESVVAEIAGVKGILNVRYLPRLE
jgi:D-3-phosphoglycerate dehydrogenase